MTPPLDFLRNWLPSARSSDEVAEASSLRSWLDSMNGAAPEDVASSLAQRMHSMVSGQSNLHMRIKLLDTFEEVANELLPPLEREVADAPLPFTAALQAKVTPVYEEMPGWQQSTQGARSWADLPAEAIKYVRRIEELIQCPVALLSTSPERDDTILVTDPFAD